MSLFVSFNVCFHTTSSLCGCCFTLFGKWFTVHWLFKNKKRVERKMCWVIWWSLLLFYCNFYFSCKFYSFNKLKFYVYVLQVYKLTERFTDKSNIGSIKCVAISQQGLLASGGTDEIIHIFNLENHRLVGTLTHHSGY